MRIKRLQVERVRNLSSIALSDFSTLNIFIGENGSGKTSLLEAISIASQGRSFRHHKIQTVIHHEQQDLQVFMLCESSAGVEYRLGISRNRGNQYQIKINGETVNSLAELTSVIPVLVLDASAFQLLDGSPSVRCKFIDWGVFHTEPGFYRAWRSYTRLLKQRNSWLKQKIDDYQQLQAWDIEFAKLSVAIEQYRQQFLAKFSVYMQATLAELDAELAPIELFYRNGWQDERFELIAGNQTDITAIQAEHFLAQLKAQFSRDLRYQRTHLGPHRADLQIKCLQNDARDVLSRGQKKTLISAMKLAQARMLADANQIKPILLLDDLPAELDSEHLQQFLSLILKDNFQSFITSVNTQFVEDQNLLLNCNKFHVERGRIEPFTACNKLGEQ